MRKIYSLIFLLLFFVASSITTKAQEKHNHRHSSEKTYEIPDTELESFSKIVVKELSIPNEKEANAFKAYLSEQGFITYVRSVYSEKVNASVNKKINVQEYLNSYKLAIKTYYEAYLLAKQDIIETPNKVLENSPFNIGSTARTMAVCTNADFETGNCNGWTMQLGTAATATQTVNGVTYNQPSSIGASSCGSGQHTIVSPGNDPNIGAALPMVPPGGGNFSLMLGDYNVGYNAPIASQTFTVGASTTSFIIRYAVVLEDGTHAPASQPYFRISLKDQAGNNIVCGQFYSVAGSGNDPSFVLHSSGYYYKPWTTVAVPLLSQVGQNVTIECIVSDCDAGGHLGYAYIDCSCAPLGVTSTSPSICGSNSISITAPAGGISYAWTTPPAYTGTLTGQSITTSAPGNYQIHVVTDASNAACAYDIDTIFPGNPTEPFANFTAPAVCVGSPTLFTDASTPAGSITQWQWDFNNDGVIDNTTQNPSNVFAAAGTYPVSLSITWPPCVADTVINVVVNPGVSANITQAAPVCINAAAFNLSAVPAGGTWSGTGITNAAAGTFNPTTAGAGPHVIRYDVGGACPGYDTMTIVVNPLPTPTAAANSPCVGQALNLTGGPAGQAAANYDWTGPVAYANTQNPTKAVAAASDGGVYTLTYTDGNGCVNTATVNVIIKPLPTPTASSNTPICVGQTLNLNSGGGGTYSWWGPNGFASAIQAPSRANVTAAEAGVYHVSVTGANGCVDSITTTVVVNPLPVATASSNSPVCFGQTLNISGGPAGQPAANYDWTGPVTYNNTQNPTKSNVALSDAGIYTLTFTDGNGCQDTAKVNVVINPLPNPTASSNTPVCFGQTLTLTGGPSAMTNYAWWGPNGYSNATQSPTVSATAILANGGTYHLSVTDANGCVDSITTTVVINPLPNPIVSNNGPRCADSTITLTAAGGNGYSWWGPNNFSSAISNPQIVNAQITHNGIYHVTVTDANGCVDSSTTTVLVHPEPVANAGADGSVCAGNNATLTGSGAGAGGSYSWLSNAGIVSLSNTLTAGPSANTWYELTVTDVHGCKDRDSAKIMVNPLPVVNFTNTTICQGDSTRFTNTSADTSGGAFTSFWSFGNAGGNTSNLTNPSLIYSVCGNFNVTLIITTDSSCQDATTKSITVNCVPTAAFSTANVCYPAAATFNNTSTISGSATLSYNWDYNYTASTHTSDFVTGSNNASNNYTDGTYVVDLIASTAAGCADTVSHSITIYPKPNADFSTNNVCLHQTTNFTDLSSVNAPDNIATWQWDYNYVAPPPFTFDYTAATGAGASNIYPNLSATNAALVVTSNNGCKDTVIHPITIYPLPVPSFTVPPVCLNTTSVFTNNSTISSGSISSYNWEFDTLAGGPSSGVISPTYTYTTSGDFPVQLTATSNFGCTHDTVIIATVYPNPVVDFVADLTQGCEPLCINLTDLSTISTTPPGSVNSTYSWVFGDGDVATGANQAHCYQDDGSYDVTLTVTSNFNCTTTLLKPAYITVYPNPVAEFSINPTAVDILDPNIVVIDLSMGADYVNWNFGDSTTHVQSSNNENMNHAYADTGCYNITQVVTTIHGCVDSTIHPICVGPEFIFYAPNAFTPNGDGKNDLFNGKGIGIIKYELLIFDRWGELINRIETLSGGWDGTKFGTGEICQTDVYVWKVNLTDVFHKPHKYIGSVTLLK